MGCHRKILLFKCQSHGLIWQVLSVGAVRFLRRIFFCPPFWSLGIGVDGFQVQLEIYAVYTVSPPLFFSGSV